MKDKRELKPYKGYSITKVTEYFGTTYKSVHYEADSGWYSFRESNLADLKARINRNQW